MTNNEPIRADMDRLWGSIMEMGRIGATPGGGVGRIALTDLDRQARDLFVTWCEESGCSVRVEIGERGARKAAEEKDSKTGESSVTNNDPIRADRDRLWGSIMEMGRIGATPGGGVGRIALTDLDRQARDLFVTWCEESGCSLRVDRMGNIFARRDGSDAALAPVMTGSHLDTNRA